MDNFPPDRPPRNSCRSGYCASNPSATGAPMTIGIVVTIVFALGLVFLVAFFIASRFFPNHPLVVHLRGGRRRRQRHADGREVANFASALSVVHGLDESLIALIPICMYEGGAGVGGDVGTECAVCLGEFRQGDALRVLPKCAHAFHILCIDKWLCAHITCPMCRSTITATNVMPPPSPGVTILCAPPQSPRADLPNLKRSFSEGVAMQERRGDASSSSSSSSSSSNVLEKSKSLTHNKEVMSMGVRDEAPINPLTNNNNNNTMLSSFKRSLSSGTRAFSFFPKSTTSSTPPPSNDHPPV